MCSCPFAVFSFPAVTNKKAYKKLHTKMFAQRGKQAVRECMQTGFDSPRMLPSEGSEFDGVKRKLQGKRETFGSSGSRLSRNSWRI